MTGVNNTNVGGFTVMELLVAMTIAAVMMVMAIPAFNDFTAQRSMAAAGNTLVSAVNYARNEAARTGNDVSLRTMVMDAANEWGSGFCATADPDDCNDPFRVFVSEGRGVTFNAINGLDGVDRWTFNSRGMLTGGINGEVRICGTDADQDPGRLLRLSPIGRATVEEFDCFP